LVRFWAIPSAGFSMGVTISNGGKELTLAPYVDHNRRGIGLSYRF
jgi:hypothetical protein